MASILQTDDEDTNKGQQPLLQATAQAPGALGSSNGSVPIAPKKASGFVDLGAYEKANQGAGNQMAGQIVGDIQNKVSSGANTLGNEVSSYANNAQGLVRNANYFNGKDINSATQQDKDIFGDFVNPLGGENRGLANFNSAQGQNQLNNAVNYANTTATAPGQAQALRNMAYGRGVRGYSVGENNLDTGLVGRSEDAQRALRNERDTASQQVNQDIQQAQGQATAARQQVIDSTKAAQDNARNWLYGQQATARQNTLDATQQDQAAKEAQLRGVAGSNYDALKAANPNNFNYTAGLDTTRDTGLLNRISALDQLAQANGLGQTLNYNPLGTSVNQSQLDNLKATLQNINRTKPSTNSSTADNQNELGGFGDLSGGKGGILRNALDQSYIGREINKANDLSEHSIANTRDAVTAAGEKLNPAVGDLSRVINPTGAFGNQAISNSAKILPSTKKLRI